MKKNYTEIFGWHAVIAALENEQTVVTKVFISNSRGMDGRKQRVLSLAKEQRILVETVTREHMDQRWGYEHQGIAAESSHNPAMIAYSEEDIETVLTLPESSEKLLPKLILILDGIQDPHNLGACLRSAGAAKVCCVIAPKDRSVGLTPAAKKVACGAAEAVPFIQVTNLARTMKKLQSLGVWIYGLDGQAEQSIFETSFSGNVALVLGAEEHGMRRLTIENCDALIKIPMFGEMESLNVSVAAGIALFRVRCS